MASETVLLCSSNSNKEYLLDILECIGRPRGNIMHFRYAKKYVNQDLWDKLPIKSEKGQNPLLGVPVLTVFVYQEGLEGKPPEWRHLYPIRLGRMRECHKTGNNEHDLAYFYFELEGYCELGEGDEEERNLLSFNQENMRRLVQANGSRSFASIRQSPIDLSTNAHVLSDDSTFQSTVGRFNMDHFRSLDAQVRYFPVFLRIQGIHPANLLEYDPILRQRSYELTEGNNYAVEANIFLRESPGRASTISFICPAAQFVGQSTSIEAVAARYDEFVWRLIPSKVSSNVTTLVRIKTNIEAPDKEREVLRSRSFAIPVPKIRLEKSYCRDDR